MYYSLSSFSPTPIYLLLAKSMNESYKSNVNIGSGRSKRQDFNSAAARCASFCNSAVVISSPLFVLIKHRVKRRKEEPEYILSRISRRAAAFDALRNKPEVFATVV